MLYFVHYSFHWIPFTFSMALDRVSRSVLADTALTCLKRGKSSGPDFWIDQSVEIRGACQHHSGTWWTCPANTPTNYDSVLMISLLACMQTHKWMLIHTHIYMYYISLFLSLSLSVNMYSLSSVCGAGEFLKQFTWKNLRPESDRERERGRLQHSKNETWQLQSPIWWWSIFHGNHGIHTHADDTYPHISTFPEPSTARYSMEWCRDYVCEYEETGTNKWPLK